jgi:hypothetical protein
MRLLLTKSYNTWLWKSSDYNNRPSHADYNNRPSHAIADYNNRPSHSIVFMSAITSTVSGRLHGEFVFLLFLQTHRETDWFLAASGVHLAQSRFHFRRVVFSSHLKSKVYTRVDLGREKALSDRTRRDRETCRSACAVPSAQAFLNLDQFLLFYYEQQVKRELKGIHISGYRCNERLKAKTDGSKRLTYTGLRGDLEHLTIETRFIGESFECVMGECVI